MRPVRAALLAASCASTLTGCPEDDELLTHGFVQLAFERGESQDMNPYVGTAQVVATMAYEECLAAFYDNNPGMRAEGPEGSLVFGREEDGGEGWSDRLCQPGQVDSQAQCEIVSIVQNFETVNQVTITYQIEQTGGDIEGYRLLFGPIPTEATADCVPPTSPVVRIGANGAVKGRNGAGDDIWTTESFSPGSAVTGQGAPIRIGAARK
ncbi:MAG: hypothetical protein IAG13_11995 [Deltaproteobacteria bacterium]|nr:hypothetical protein [Nannocystaceae bacterium]